MQLPQMILIYVILKKKNQKAIKTFNISSF